MNLRVLFVEDDNNLATSIIHYLELNSITCDYCSDGHFALNLLKDNQYDVIISDVNMPVMDGYTATTYLRDHDYKGAIIALTAHAMDGEKAKCMAAGCNDFGTKPVERKVLVATVESWWRKDIVAETA